MKKIVLFIAAMLLVAGTARGVEYCGQTYIQRAPSPVQKQYIKPVQKQYVAPKVAKVLPELSGWGPTRKDDFRLKNRSQLFRVDSSFQLQEDFLNNNLELLQLYRYPVPRGQFLNEAGILIDGV